MRPSGNPQRRTRPSGCRQDGDLAEEDDARRPIGQRPRRDPVARPRETTSSRSAPSTPSGATRFAPGGCPAPRPGAGGVPEPPALFPGWRLTVASGSRRSVPAKTPAHRLVLTEATSVPRPRTCNWSPARPSTNACPEIDGMATRHRGGGCGSQPWPELRPRRCSACASGAPCGRAYITAISRG